MGRPKKDKSNTDQSHPGDVPGDSGRSEQVTIKLLTGIATATVIYIPGQILQVSQEEANQLIEDGAATKIIEDKDTQTTEEGEG